MRFGVRDLEAEATRQRSWRQRLAVELGWREAEELRVSAHWAKLVQGCCLKTWFCNTQNTPRIGLTWGKFNSLLSIHLLASHGFDGCVMTLVQISYCFLLIEF